MKWVLADPHLFHKKIVTHFMFRPYASVEEMNEDIIDTINQYVKESHTLYLLGDISFEYDPDKNLEILKKINCKNIHLVVGNHDHTEMRELPIWKSVNHYLEVKNDKKFFVLCHYPFESWNRSSKGSIMVHGHCHGSSKKVPNRFDVGWDVRGRPVSLDELILEWNDNPDSWVDHHAHESDGTVKSLWKRISNLIGMK
ncbi:putative metallophosphatase protein [Rhizobium phage RHph_TM39]|uniref:Putative metallophosphatase protein n=1 Tax=Rhizobium phage RHph_Y65 TaxID=2509785 RepID=A0A7S5R7Q4_9CAUD|nr:phosphoesterase [Rhizobium phage RHph_Y65]QIG72647.1 putative metallophosphatase protein [Rhizobium phage RHph_Y65]QIG77079.1 putative metallophosphatase protein [Rhizobium phage RHph_TM39]QIG77417.1 putative metallophosphatase protein [Rhizobium phage RHph_TM21B]